MLNTNVYNPDVLTCLANLSSDEVFTPPNLVNEILDLLPDELWHDKNATFLDPACKSGVFLREIAKRLLEGLQDEIPDLQSRIDHIFQKQLFGIAITELTSLLSRRSLYCSKQPNGKYSITLFENFYGNISYKNIEHDWMNRKCSFCGASQVEYDRDIELESHAYEFIHTKKPEEIFKMRFDVIIGNPPYQLETGGAGRQAKPIYQHFINQAKKLNPRYLSMIIPSRWFSGGMGLNKFRKSMLEDNRIKYLVDYTNSKDCFPQSSISGGVCYFLWSRDYNGLCSFTSIHDGDSNNSIRSLNEFPVLIRYNKAVDIIRKILVKREKPLSNIASSLTPFGLPTNYRGKKYSSSLYNTILHSSEGISYISENEIKKGHKFIDKYKVMISKTGSEHAGEPDKEGKFKVLTSSMKVLGGNEICTHSYFIVGGYDNKKFADNLLYYLMSKFVRFLILQSMSSINLSKAVFQFVPLQDFSKRWTDKDLYSKYGLSDDEISFVESMIRPMELRNEDDNA